jgi:nucleoside-diphosphate-sugar epimerase
MISKSTVFIDSRLGEAKETLANNNKLKETFGWQPTKNIEEYIKEMLNA